MRCFAYSARLLVDRGERQVSCNALKRVGYRKDMTFDEVYSAFGKIEPSRIINPSQLGLLDAADKQARKAGISVCQKGMSVDEAVRIFGSFE